MDYRRVTHEDRVRIKAGLDEGLSKAAIARKLGFHRSSIGREVARNMGGRGYRPKQAQRLAEERERSKHGPTKMNPVMISLIEERLEQKWSPEQISNRLRRDGELCVSTETIYKFIAEDRQRGGDLWKHLRRSGRRRKRRFPSVERRGQIRNARPIKQRGNYANNRKQLGHWERDTMHGGDRKASVLVITDRKSRFNKLQKINRRKAMAVSEQTVSALKRLPVRSITNDRGLEFSDHESCARKLKVKVYFCDPYTPSQRGTNENRIGALRQYLPKGLDLRSLTQANLNKIEFEINNRPMKCLDWRTPYEVMMENRCAR
jgi:IS30 family transposase